MSREQRPVLVLSGRAVRLLWARVGLGFVFGFSFEFVFGVASLCIWICIFICIWVCLVFVAVAVGFVWFSYLHLHLFGFCILAGVV